MTVRTKRMLFWAPRVLGIVFALFLSLFALDVFGAGQSVGETILALLIHLIPVYVVIIILAVAWRWEWVGTLGFTALALLYLAWGWGRFEWIAYVVICGPLVLTGGLFWLNWMARAQLRAT